MFQGGPKLDDDAGVTIRQVAGATLRVKSGGARLVFELDSSNNVQNCVFDGFEQRGIFVDGGNNAQILNNTITVGIDPQANDRAAVLIRDSLGSVVAGNTVALNAMDGEQIRSVIGIFVDQNTIADNGGSGIEFYGDDSSGV